MSLPAELYLPAGQVLHDLPPVATPLPSRSRVESVAKVPALHSWHDSIPCFFAIRPMSHDSHSSKDIASDALRYVPLSQGEQTRRSHEEHTQPAQSSAEQFPAWPGPHLLLQDTDPPLLKIVPYSATMEDSCISVPSMTTVPSELKIAEP